MAKAVSKPKSNILDKATEQVKGKFVFVKSRRGGTMPLEWPRVDPKYDRRAIDFEVKDRDGNVIERVEYRKLEFGHEGLAKLNLADPDDFEFFEMVKDWYENSNDKRIAKYQVEIIENGNVEPPPFPRYENMKASVVADMIANFMGEDAAENEQFLLKCARYELQMKEPRASVLDAIEYLGVDAGDESGDGEVIEA
jgi:hypothetical protein